MFAVFPWGYSRQQRAVLLQHGDSLCRKGKSREVHVLKFADSDDKQDAQAIVLDHKA